jgi:3-oxoadipate enol-lactonase
MPKTFNGAVELYWESSGAGPPVLLIAGQGMTLDAWWRTAQTLERSFRVVTFDNRDVGRSSHLPWPYGVPQMVDDAVAVLDAAGIARAHVYGISLGGMIAQELALRHPHRVGALVLGATTPGGPDAVLARPEPLTFFVRVGAMAPEEAEWAAVPYNYSLRTRRRHGDRIATDIARRIAHQTDSLAYLHQVAAAAGHSAAPRLGRLRAPTLIVHGQEDLVVPPQNAHQLARVIRDAELQIWPNAGHLYITDEPEADLQVRRFLAAQTGTGSGAANAA